MLVIKDFHELVALNKALFEARFHANPDSEEVQGSPLLAAVHNRLVEALIATESDQGNRSKWQEWRQWRNRGTERQQLQQIIKRVNWTSFAPDQKDAFVRCLIAPFVADDEEINILINLGNRFHEEKDQ